MTYLRPSNPLTPTGICCRVLTAEGSRIFLDEQAAAFLDDKILDTELHQNGQGTFVLAQQDQSTPGL